MFQNTAWDIGKAILQAALMGNGPLGGLFDGAGRNGKPGGLLGGLLGSVMGFGGGYVRGPGTGTSDSIPARLSRGEHVVNAVAARKHLALLEAINAGRVPGFAQGGLGGAPAGASPAVAGILT